MSRTTLRCSLVFTVACSLAACADQNLPAGSDRSPGLRAGSGPAIYLDQAWTEWRYPFVHGDIAVADLAWDKEVTVVFTTDAWATTQTAEAWYDGPLGSEYERWSFQATYDAEFGDPVAFDFALSYTVDGQTYWDNDGGADHHLAFDRGDEVTLDPVVGVLYAQQSWGTPPFFAGALGLANLAYDKRVSVLYSAPDGHDPTEAVVRWQRTEGDTDVFGFSADLTLQRELLDNDQLRFDILYELPDLGVTHTRVETIDVGGVR